MPLNKTYITAHDGFDESNFDRSVVVWPVRVNPEQIRFEISTNLSSTPLNIRLNGVTDDNFDGQSVEQSFTTALGGTASLTYDINPSQLTPKDFNATIISDNDLELATSSNVTIDISGSITATGGTETSFNVGTADEYKVHTFTSDGSLNVTEANDVGTVYQQIVGGGGAGGSSFRYQEVFFGAFNDWDLRTGGGGAGAQSIQSNVSAETYSVANYPIVIGTGGQGSTTQPTSATSSTFNSLTALPGGYGGSYDQSYRAETGMRNAGGGGSVKQDLIDHTVTYLTNGYAPNPPIIPKPAYNSSYAYWIAKDLSTQPSGGSIEWGNPTAYNGVTGDYTGNWDSSSFPPGIDFVNQGKRPLSEGGDGSRHDGGNATTSINYTSRFSGNAGTGSSENRDGVDQSTAKINGEVLWVDYPQGTTTNELGQGGRGGHQPNQSFAPYDTNQGEDATEYGSGGGGGNAIKITSDGTDTTISRGGNGGNGVVKIAYKKNIPSFGPVASPPDPGPGPNEPGDDEWTPAQLTTSIWLDAFSDTDISFSSGTNVNAWTNKGTNSASTNFSQNNSTLQPQYDSANGCVTFNGSTDYMGANGLQDLAGDPNVTTVALINFVSKVGVNDRFLQIGKGGETSSGTEVGQTALAISGGIGTGNGGWSFRYNTGFRSFGSLNTNTQYLTSWVKRLGQTIVSNSGELFLNGSAQSVDSNGTNTTIDITAYPSGPSTFIGAGPGGWESGFPLGQTFYANIKIHELVTIKSTDVDDRQRLEGYMAWRWGIQSTLPADHPYKSAAPRV